jgi:hypothetical protein
MSYEYRVHRRGALQMGLTVGAGMLCGGAAAAIPAAPSPIAWNPHCKVVADHRDGTIDRDRTDRERAARGLPVPWTPEIGDREVWGSPVY